MGLTRPRKALWGSRVSASTISELNQKAYVHIEEWCNRKLSGKYPYVYVDGIYLKRNWGGEFENVSILVAIGVDEDGYREVIGAAEGMKEDAESWKNFLIWLKERGLEGVKLIYLFAPFLILRKLLYLIWILR